MKVKHLKEGELRVIKVGREALTEMIFENFMENGADYFDLLDSTKFVFHMKWDSETDELVCFVQDERYPLKIELDEVAQRVGITTDSFYSKNLYKTVYLGKQGDDSPANSQEAP